MPGAAPAPHRPAPERGAGAGSVPIRWLARTAQRRGAVAAPTRFDPAEFERAEFEPAEFEPALRTQLLILQPTPFCNIRCDYCYLPDRDSTARMSLATVRLAVQRLRDDRLLGDALGIVWHAGEPLAMPRSFYADAIDIIDAEIGALCRVTHSIQTNATLLDDAWCDFIKAHDLRIGVSIDGPRELHDRHRRTRSGQGTFDRVVRGMELLRAHGIGFHAIAVVTDATLAQPDAFCDFFEAHGVFEIGCNVDEAEGAHAASSLAGVEAAHAAFIARLLERSVAAGARLQVRELTQAFALVAQPLPLLRWRGHALPHNPQVTPFALVTVASNGDFGCFSPELLGQAAPEFGNFVLGNVARGGYLESAASERFARLWSGVARGTAACERGCAHFGFCGGGAPANKFYENGDFASTETLYCRSVVKRPFDAVLARLERDRAAPAPSPD